ncbi:hypothetical protein M409DRAFT_24943 [Zasmidium cellare ATCC 36951]|uniref:Mitochondrial outer membrane transport complex Sam37/metaxin N-terminal domain-containing protein n=1 Tax=Zasmidium cellare ATCC 36951 TaxID=1080233 RepID=A0A6A6CCR9_ZASCE|nr:uncharacterized protein M409DRAFT_24943 [Zasmidium cellare ATCC 36951]KAF2164543.1 hypothetical protein M409DRAFT_24943 [Zasmidium cellare ATCC 36951]
MEAEERTMQLFILGPAFGLPSIDAECNAAVALLQLHVRDKYGLVPTHDQVHRLPFLIDGQAQISGYNNIARHFAHKRISSETSQLSSHQRADSLALTSFIESQAQKLLDISLYVGFENYRLATRPAFSKILPWHANYTLPPKRRTAARTRTEHLGVSSIDVDNVHEDMSHRPPGFEGVGKEPGFEAETQKRASLLLPKKETVMSLLQQPQHSAVFKLHAIAENFFEPLQEVLGDENYLLGTEQPTVVDCLLYGYLSMMLFPQLPQDWLATTMKRKYKSLVRYTERIRDLLGLTADVDDVLALYKCKSKGEAIAHRQAGKMSLPYTLPHTPSFSKTFAEIRTALWEQVPILGTPQLQLHDAKQFPFLDRNLASISITFAASLAAAGYLAIRTGTLVWPHGEEVQIFGRKRLSDFGHIGAALAGVTLLGSQAGRGG